MNYYIDKRIFVTGKKSVMFMDDPFNLTQYIIELIGTFGITNARNGLRLETILNTSGLMTNEVYMGGPLIEDTTITGAGFSWELTGCDTITLDSTIGLDILSRAMTLSADTIMYFQTPNIVSQTSVSNGQTLKLIDSLTGECEWSDDRFVLTFSDIDWVGTNIVVLSNVHGRGNNPIVQVINDAIGYQVLPGNSLGIAGLWLDEIKIAANGDVTIVHGSNGIYNGRTIII